MKSLWTLLAPVITPIVTLYAKYVRRGWAYITRDGKVTSGEFISLARFCITSITVAVKRGLMLDKLWALIRHE